MAKINFTEVHFQELCTLANKFLFQGSAFKGPVGQILTVYDLIHTTTVDSLIKMKSSLEKTIAKSEDVDDWTASTEDVLKQQLLKQKGRFIYLLIGYKRYTLEQESIALEKAKLTKQLNELKESQKTPEEKIKELEDQINSL